MASRWPAARGPRGENQLDSGSYYYEVYECSDGQYHLPSTNRKKVSCRTVAAAGDRSLPVIPDQRDRCGLATAGRTLLTRSVPARVLAMNGAASWKGSDACFAPVLSMQEAHTHAHNQARNAFIDIGWASQQPAPAPRVSAARKLAVRQSPARIAVPLGGSVFGCLGLGAGRCWNGLSESVPRKSVRAAYCEPTDLPSKWDHAVVINPMHLPSAPAGMKIFSLCLPL